ncbi:hypothetical protein PLICRDRAFT_702397 [Plicaturopsis crispa FD-325 SS-3]|uniref:DUF6534 domain-containing protein n=1 Tax=Plicaturopsis crispa FD-325 SS-3 TaxID=944288 RepID=A0A0C9T3G8_PLICR|nr:hypothetical protein PLICRDRAFT_702397 [Plicaturopsis crispa FD-325 SS-3]
MEASPSFALDNTVGALEIGIIVSACLFGITTSQAHTYFRKYPDDPRWTKALVLVVWWCELAHLVAVSTSIYNLSITDFAQPQMLVHRQPGVVVSILVSAVLGPLVQSFFAYRIRKISGSPYIPVLCWCLCAARLPVCILAAVEGFRTTNALVYISQWRPLFIGLLSVSAFNDVTIAVTLTAEALDRLIIWTIQTGLITSVTAVAVLVTCLSMPDNYVWLGIWILLARLFSNSLLAWLNQRTVGSAFRPNAVNFPQADRLLPRGTNRTDLTVTPVVSIDTPKATGMAAMYDHPYATAQADMELGWVHGRAI